MASNKPSSTPLWGTCPFRSFSTSTPPREQQQQHQRQQQWLPLRPSGQQPSAGSSNTTSLEMGHNREIGQMKKVMEATCGYGGPFLPRQQMQEKLPDGSSRFKLSRYAGEMLDSLYSIRQDGCLCDVTLHTAESGGEGIKAHKVVLAGSSLYFRGMFTRGMREETMSEVCIREANISREALETLINFAYTGEIHITQDNVEALLVSAAFLQMRHVSEACTVYLEQQLDPSNCVGIVKFARAHDCMDLEAKARRYVYEHFCDVSKHEEILDLTAEDMAEIVQREDLNINCESEVFSAVVRWAEHDPQTRVDQLESLLAHGVRLSTLAPSFLEDQLQRCHLIRRQPNCYKLLMDRVRRLTQHEPVPCAGASGSQCKGSFASKTATSNVFDSEESEEAGLVVEPPPRRPGGQMVIYVAGGFYRKVMDSLKSFECYDPSTKEWARLPDLLRPRCGPGVTTLHGRVCVVGGRVMQCGINTDSCSLDMYDPRENQWMSCCHMNQARSRVGVALLDSRIYAIGGSSGGELHSSAERYHQDTDHWEYVASMNEARQSPGVAVLNRLIYVLGGFDGRKRLNSVECYHPERNQWELVSPLQRARSGAGVAVLRGQVYAVGGFDGSRQLTSVERYDPSKDSWEEVAPLLRARSGVGVAVIDDNLFALGGFDGSDFLPCVERYDPDTDSWHPETAMLCERSGHGVTVGRMPTLS